MVKTYSRPEDSYSLLGMKVLSCMCLQITRTNWDTSTADRIHIINWGLAHRFKTIMASTTANTPEDPSLLDTLNNLAPASLAKFDAFPKLPATYKTRSESRGFMTIFVVFVAILLVLNDLGEFLWGWPDHEFSVDRNVNPNLEINLDMVVAMPCSCKSIDLVDKPS